MSRSFPVTISHVANAYKRYPGESVQLQTRVTILAAVTELTVTVTVPAELEIIDDCAVHNGQGAELTTVAGVRTLRWHEGNNLVAGRCLDYMIEARIDADQLVWLDEEAWDADTTQPHSGINSPTVGRDRLMLESKATVDYAVEQPEQTGESQGESTASALAEQLSHPAQPDHFVDETTEITVLAKGSYLQFLPALYEQDDFMGRFLMLFESFWGPIEAQVAQIHHVFDPAMTQSTLLPWLASWYELELDGTWSEAQKRAVLKQIMRLYRKRGAQQGLAEYLTHFSGGQVQITEYAADSFRIGRDAQIGSGIAFGSNQAPHTFAVQVTDPRIADKCEGPITTDVRDARLAQLAELMAAIIEAEKPAHTVCAALNLT